MEFKVEHSIGYSEAIEAMKELKKSLKYNKDFRIKVLLIAPEGHSSVYVLGGG